MTQRSSATTRTRCIDLDAVIFDLDGVVTRTADIHAAAWEAAFDAVRRAWMTRGRPSFSPFDPEVDYLAHVDGKPRHEGIRAFLATRGIRLPEGSPTDGPEALTIQGVGAHKDALFVERVRRVGVAVFPSTVSLLQRLREQGVKIAVVTSSRNGREVLDIAGIAELFDVRVDGVDAAALGLKGKPNPDPFLHAAELLGAPPERTVVIEDATSGVEAGRRAGLGLVVGVDRGGNREALSAHGADVVVADLEELDVRKLDHLLLEKHNASLAWSVEQEGFDPAREHGMESLFTVANGYLGVRGALDSPLPGSHGDLFIAGVYDKKSRARPYSQLELLSDDRGDHQHTELVSMPFPFRLRVLVDGIALAPSGRLCRTHRRKLNLQKGILHGHAEYDIGVDRRVAVRTRRCASSADRHLLLQELTVCLFDHTGMVELDTSTTDPDLETNHPHLSILPVAANGHASEVKRFITRASGVEICLVARTFMKGELAPARYWRVPAPMGHTLRFRRYIAVFTSRDVDDPEAAARERLDRLRWPDFDRALALHATRWSDVWGRGDIAIQGSPATEQALRFNTYHLVGAAAGDPRVSVGARALTGRAYEGHVFWDVEMFELPFYLHTLPDVARCLLLYRHRTLPGARRRAKELGYRGACYAWESTVTGDDVTPRAIRLKSTATEIPIFTGEQQVHVTAAVAYGVWQYWEATRDRDFLTRAGVEILVETARFWTSRAIKGSQHFHIRGVVGPDEYHHSVNDNAYTNWLARANLEYAVKAAEWIHREDARSWGAIAERLRISAHETSQWTEVARDLYCPGPRSDGVIEQFEGFFDLEDYALPSEARFKAPISRLFDWQRINRMKLVKQADVLMLLHVLPSAFPRAIMKANYRYYEPITDHGSSLSPGIHAAIAARIGFREDAERYWRESLWLDLSDRMENSALGIHAACMGATWQALVFGFLGIRFTESGPIRDTRAAPMLPAKWRDVALTLAWRGKQHSMRISHQEPG